MCRLAASVVLAALAAVSQARAQRVRGAVTDSVTGLHIAGVVVTLTDSAGGFLSRAIAGPSGEYSVFRPAAARRMRVVRIGYRPRDLAIAGDSVMDLRMQPVPALLGAVEQSDRRICPGRTGSIEAIDVWEQARAGLLASMVSREASPPRIRLRSFRRTLDPVRRALVADTTEYRDLVVDRSFVAARAAWAFSEYGYMRESVDGNREYFAPDEAVLLDRTFAGTHCLRLVDGRDPRGGQVGIAFEPVRDELRDTIVDINGVLWLERTTLQLRRLEYRYTNLEPSARDAGGEIDFAFMPNGVPMIERWMIHTPMLAYDVEVRPDGTVRSVARGARRNVRTLGYRETGGQIAFASWPDGSRWQSDLPRLRGVVLDQSRQPVPNALVWLRGTPDTAKTDAAGRFEMPPVPPGLYVVTASDSALAAEGIPRSLPVYTTVFVDAAAQDVKLDFFPRTQVLASVCPRSSYKPGTGVLLARVLDSRGAPASFAEIEVETKSSAAADSLAQPETRLGEAGDDGRFVVCGIAHDRSVIVRAFKAREGAGVSIDRWGDEIVSVTLRLKPSGGR